jgi:signal transduction histidine kinase/ABC-type amino acid transport substrate-binding protein
MHRAEYFIRIIISTFLLTVWGMQTFAALPKSNTITIYWNESEPFIFRENGELKGIEYDILILFKQYLEKKYNRDFKFVFEEQKSFANVFDALAKNKNENLIGVDALAVTKDRKRQIKFSESYFANATIMISNADLPLAKTNEEFAQYFADKTAITTQRSTYEKDLQLIQKTQKTKFKIAYIPSKNNIIKTIENTPQSFGLIDLFVYLMYFQKKPTLPIIRQDLFLFKSEGYAIGFPKKSIWHKEFNEFSTFINLKKSVQTIIPHYTDTKLLKLLNSIDSDSKSLELSMLEEEKEIQSEHLKLKEKTIELEKKYTIALVIFAILFLLLTIVILLSLLRLKKSAKILQVKNLQIETQQKSIAEQNTLLEKKNGRLTGLNEEKNAIMRVLAHDLRAPLTSIRGLSDILLMDTDKLSEDQIKSLNFITESTIRMNRMISNLLDTDALEKGESKMVLENTELITVIGFAIRNFDIPAKEKNITINFVSPVSRCIIKADYMMLMEVLENLLSNALKFSYRNSNVDVKVIIHNQIVKISISDYGVGMNNEDVDVVFKKYQKLSSKPTENEKSIGLGLSITKQYVEQMNGMITCESRPSEGTSFHIEFALTR